MKVYVYDTTGAVLHYTLLNVNSITETKDEFILKGKDGKQRYEVKVNRRFYKVKVFTFRSL